MKIPLLILFLLSFSLSCLVNPAFSAQTESFPLTSIPLNIRESIIVSGKPVPHIQDFAVMGWSEKGKIALLLGDWSPYIQDYTARFVVIDVVTDLQEAMVGPQFMQDLVEQGEPLPVNPENPLGLEYFYHLNQEKIKNLLIEYKIRPQSGSFNFATSWKSGNEIHFDLEILEATPRHNLGKPPVYSVFQYRIIARSEGQGQKVLGSQSYKKAYVIGASVLGYITSPFENLVAVLVQETFWGLKLEHSTRFLLYGCRLDSGFMEENKNN